MRRTTATATATARIVPARGATHLLTAGMCSPSRLRPTRVRSATRVEKPRTAVAVTDGPVRNAPAAMTIPTSAIARSASRRKRIRVSKSTAAASGGSCAGGTAFK